MGGHEIRPNHMKVKATQFRQDAECGGSNPAAPGRQSVSNSWEAGGSASALSLSRPAQASLTLRPAELLSRPKRPLSRGSSPSGYPAEPLVSYQINRQLSGWNLPPLIIRAFGAHCQERTWVRCRW